jgi:hypothetical protein
MLHDKANGVATLSTSKAFVNFFGGGNSEGGRLFVVERAVADIVGSPSFQLYERPHDIMDIDPVLNFLYGLLGDQREVRVEGVSLKKEVKYCKFTKFF